MVAPVIGGALSGFMLTKPHNMGKNLDPQKIEQIKKGVTSREEVIASLGSPSAIGKDANNNTVFTYTYHELGSTLSTMFKSNYDPNTSTLMITFDTSGKVKDVVSSYK